MQVTNLKAQLQDKNSSGISKQDGKNDSSPGTQQLKDQACCGLHLSDAQELPIHGLFVLIWSARLCTCYAQQASLPRLAVAVGVPAATHRCIHELALLRRSSSLQTSKRS